MVQVLHPVDPLAHKPRTSSFRCSPLTRRRTLPTAHDLLFSQSAHQNAIERAALRKLSVQILSSGLTSFPKLAPSYSLPAVPTPTSHIPPGVSDQVEAILPQEIPGTPATPLEIQEHCPEYGYQPEPQQEPKANIFKNTTNSDALLDLTIAALHRIYIDDFSATSWSTEFQPEPTVSMQAPSWPTPRISINYCEQSPPSISSSVSSASSTPSSLPTTPAFSPSFDPEIASAEHKDYTASPAAGFHAKPVGRTQSAPLQGQVQAPTLGDKGKLRWFLIELLRRSRASASVVQLALHYLAQARGPVGDILRRRFKSGVRQGQEDDESPLLDPRKLLLAALMLSTKLLHDHAPNNRAWARVCGLEPRDVGACERALGQALDWKLANMFVGPRDEDPVVV